jgi:hypothetical protein
MAGGDGENQILLELRELNRRTVEANIELEKMNRAIESIKKDVFNITGICVFFAAGAIAASLAAFWWGFSK